MKRFLLFTAMLFMALGVFAQYVDLGLPSGTKWKSFNEPDLYSHGEAISKFTDQLPTYEQWGELYGICDWIRVGSAYKVIGPNGNFIKFPAVRGHNCIDGLSFESFYGIYWSSAPDGSDDAYYLYFNSYKVVLGSNFLCRGGSVRLVQD